MNLTILKSNADLENWQKTRENHQINFVPTMGSLHTGHKKLIIKASQTVSSRKPSSTIVSIFVNPLQFNANEDFAKYPRNIENDSSLAFEAGADAIWAPSLKNIFPKGDDSPFRVKAPKNLQQNLCGAFRDNHFDGVATVVIRLLKLIKPSNLFLGEKDWQQLTIIRKLIKELSIPVEIHSIETVRDKDGLAYSSRNQYLTNQERYEALNLPKILSQAAKDYKKNHSLSIRDIKSSLENTKTRVQYLELVDYKSLQKIHQQENQNISLLAAAVHCGNTRLIDHIFLMKRNPIVAIDGPAGAGKSTVTKQFAQKLGLIYLDTGAMYRAITWLIQHNRIDPKNHTEIAQALNNFNLDIKLSSDGLQKVFLNQKEITNEIRSPQITSQVSKIAAIACVREKLTLQQQKLGQKGGLVAEGRDIGTAVFPEAELKIFLTASAQERARRRYLDLQEKGFEVTSLLELEKQIIKRDELDSTREIAPLVKAKDAKELITDGMNKEEVVECLIKMFKDQIPQEVWKS